MNMAARLSKEELKGPDAFQSTVELITNYIAENQKRFYSIVTAIVLAVIIAFGIYMYWDHYQTSARAIYAKVQKDVTPGMESPENTAMKIKSYQELIQKYPHSWSARMAHYHLGNIYYNSGEFDKAISDYKKFVASRISNSSGIKFLALTSIGYCYEAKQDFKSALDYFEKAQKSNNVGFEAVGFTNIARIYEQMNDKKNALDYYKKALEKSTDPSKSVFIKYKIASLS